MNTVVKKKNKAVIGGKTKWIVIIKQWIHQGFTYLDHTERFYRIIWELIPFSIAMTILLSMDKISITSSIIISFIIAHTLNWVFNYNFWTCLDFTFPRILNPGNDQTIEYLKKMQIRLSKKKYITGCMIYGSVSRHVWHNKSDLDMRIMGKKGVLNGFKIYWTVFIERLIAVREKQPLDLYQADSIKFLNRMREDEFPIFLIFRDERLQKRYGNCKETDMSKVSNLNNINNTPND